MVVASEDVFNSLRRKLDLLGYRHKFNADSLPLVKSLFEDLVLTTNGLRDAKNELASDSTAAENGLLKSENSRLSQQNNSLQRNLAELQVNYDSRIKGTSIFRIPI